MSTSSVDRDGMLNPTTDTSLVFTVVFVIAVLLLVASITYFLYMYKQKSDCENEPNYWCFNDWICNTDDETKRYPAKKLYCNPGSSVTDFNYCLDPANASQPACICNLARTGGQCIPKECTCTWGGNSTNPLGVCGNIYCTSTDSQFCSG